MNKNNNQNPAANKINKTSIFNTEAPTVPLSSIAIPRNALYENLLHTFRHKIYESTVNLVGLLQKDVTESLKSSNGYLTMNNGTIYCSSINALIDSPARLKARNTRYSSWPEEIRNLKVGNLNADLISDNDFAKIVKSQYSPYYQSPDKFIVKSVDNGRGNPHIVKSKLPVKMENTFTGFSYLQPMKGGLACCRYSSFYNSKLEFDIPSFTASLFPAFYVGKPENVLQSYQILLFWCLADIFPEKTKLESEYKELGVLLREHMDLISPDIPGLFMEETFMNSFPVSDNELAAEAETLGSSGESLKIILAPLKDELLKCDECRANIRPAYEEKLLTSPNRGHWDLWQGNDDKKEEKDVISLPCDFYARNPSHDIKKSGVIGIDFGTRSTTVVRRIDKEKNKPMRIGFSDFEKLPTSGKDYENPTVMQFIDCKSFLEAYNARKGRPYTKWADLTISHTASDRFQETTDSDVFPSFLSELKQWAGGKHILRLRDHKKNEYVIPPYGQLSEKNFDPIELYAYYIGLNINHMRNGIFLKYEISYPVTYDKDILDRIRLSFERGIKKSLPISVLNDKEIMKDFYVRYGASEPAAYSLCALTEYGFDPEGEEQHFYGVFDFGGGTTDFDFGLFREATEEEQDEGIDYVLEHFRPSGDKYLGGENILQLIAFEVFKENKEELLKKKITFPKPFETENSSFEGEEGLVSDSPEARLNMHQMMEQLRPIWESSGNKKDGKENSSKLESGNLKLTLFDKNGNQQTGISLTFDAEKLKECIRKRIEKGIVNFFARLRETFQEPYVPEQLKKINIFLAGNSCKSTIVTELFNKHIEDYEKEQGKGLFELYPPLGSEEAVKIQKKNKDTATPDSCIEMPTGKTGVAFGLVLGRAGSNYRIIDKNMDDKGIAFRFYVGKSRKGKFQPILNMTSERGKWEKVVTVGISPVIEIQYSALSEASTGCMPEEKCDSVSISTRTTDKGKILYIRVKNANEFEYAIADSEAAIVPEQIKSFNLEK